MRRFFLICLLVGLGTSISSFAQEAEHLKSSATDSKVKIHKGNRVRASMPKMESSPRGSKRSRAAAAPKESEARFAVKNKKAMTVKENQPKVYKNNKRTQKKNAKVRAKGRTDG